MIPESTSGPVYRVPLSRRSTNYCSPDGSTLSRDSQSANRRSRDSAAMSRDSVSANQRSVNGTSSLVSRPRTGSRRYRSKNHSRMGEMKDRCGSLRKENALLEEKVVALMEELDFLKQMFIKHASGKITTASPTEHQRIMSDAFPGPDVSELLASVLPPSGDICADIQPYISIIANSDSQNSSI